MPSNHLILCHPLLLLPSIFPSIRVFSKESALHIRWPNIGVSVSTSVLPMNSQDWFPTGLTGLVFCSPRDSQESSPTPQFKSINSSALIFFYSPTLTSINDYWKNHSFTRWTFVGKVMSLLFNMLSRLVIAFFQGAVQFSHWVLSDSLRPLGLQHTQPPCPSPTPRVYSNSCPLGWWCHPTTSSSVVPFSSRLQSCPASIF